MKTNDNTTAVQELWKAYRDHLWAQLPKPIPVLLEREAAMAFYAGIHSGIISVLKIAMADLTSEEKDKMMDELRKQTKLAGLEEAGKLEEEAQDGLDKS